MSDSTVNINDAPQEEREEREERKESAERIERIKYMLRLEDEDEDLISNHPSAGHLSDERTA